MSPNTHVIVVRVAIWAIVVLAAIGIFLVFSISSRNADFPPSSDVVLSVLKPELPWECKSEGIPDNYHSCLVQSSKAGEEWRATVTYDGLYDDSMKATRVEAYLSYHDGKWAVRDIYHYNQCYPGRGHEGFSSELCI